MRKLITITFVLFALTANSQISYFVQQAGKYTAYGLSTDTKPASPPNNCYFIEVNTNKTYVSIGGIWSLVGISVDSIANRLTIKTDSLATALAQSTASTYFTIASAAGKENAIAAGTTAQYWRGDKTWQTLPAGGSPTFINLASNFSSTSVTEAAVTGWNFAVTAGKTYRIEVIAGWQSAATTTGGELGFFLSASAVGTIRGFAEADIVNTAAATGLKIPIRVCTTADATGSFLISTGVTAASTPQSFYAIVTFTCTTSGTFNVGWASEVASSASQLNANSSLIYQALN